MGSVVVTRDRLVIVLLIVVALALALFGWWYRYEQGRRPIALWGGRAAHVIRNAPSAELWKLEPADDKQEEDEANGDSTIVVDGRPMRVVERMQLPAGDELRDVQKGLVQDRSFDWEEPRGDCAPLWPYALRLLGGGDEVVIALDFDCQRARLVAPRGADAMDPEVSIAPIAAGLKKIIDDWIKELGTARQSAKPQADGE
jgi:hypothetical protein